MNIKEHIGKIGLGIGSAIVGFGLFKLLNDEDNSTYSSIKLKSLSDDELETEREKVRLKYCSAGDDSSLAEKLWHILQMFDTEMSRREWKDSDNFEYPKHSEHGWYLSSDD